MAIAYRAAAGNSLSLESNLVKSASLTKYLGGFELPSARSSIGDWQHPHM